MSGFRVVQDREAYERLSPQQRVHFDEARCFLESPVETEYDDNEVQPNGERIMRSVRNKTSRRLRIGQRLFVALALYPNSRNKYFKTSSRETLQVLQQSRDQFERS